MRSFAITLALVATTSLAQAETSGFFRGGMGIGRLRTRSSTKAATNSVLDGVTATSFGLEVHAGLAIDRRWVLAATLLEQVATFDRQGKITSPLGGEYGLALFTLGLTFERRMQPRGGFFFGGTLGFAEYANRTEESPYGWAIATHAGWDFAVSARSSFGASFRLLYARMSSKRAGGETAQAFAPTLTIHYGFM